MYFPLVWFHLIGFPTHPLIQAKFKSIYKPLGLVRPVEIRTARSVWTPNNHPPAMKVDAPDCCDS